MDDDVLEGIACQACDIFDSHESKQTERTTIREALMESLGPLLEGDLQQEVETLCDELLDAADFPKESPSLPSMPLKVRQDQQDVKETGYQRRGDREKERAAEYLRQQAAEEQRRREEDLNREREALQFTRWPVTSKEARELLQAIPLPGATERPASDSDDEEDEVSRAHRESTKRRLRELGQPATFFAETDAQRWDRLQRCELARDQDVLADGSTNVMQILDRRQQREREAAGGIRGTDIVMPRTQSLQLWKAPCLDMSLMWNKIALQRKKVHGWRQCLDSRPTKTRKRRRPRRSWMKPPMR